MRTTLRTTLLVGISIASACAAHAERVRTDTFTGSDGKPVDVTVVSWSPKDAKLRVLYAAAAVPTSNTPTSLAGLVTHPKLGSAFIRERSLFSAGSSSYRTDVPVGLLVADGQLQSPIDTSPRPHAKAGCDAGASAGASFRYPGILCVPKERDGWRIVPAGDYRPGQCHEAVQAGPMLVESGGRIGVCEPSPTAHTARRLVACIDADETLHMVLTEPTTLYPLAQWLAQGRLKCTAALNLSSGDQAGWVQLATLRRPVAKYHAGTQVPLASALLIEQRQAPSRND